MGEREIINNLLLILIMFADYNPRMIDVPLSLQSCSKAVILVCTFLT